MQSPIILGFLLIFCISISHAVELEEGERVEVREEVVEYEVEERHLHRNRRPDIIVLTSDNDNVNQDQGTVVTQEVAQPAQASCTSIGSTLGNGNDMKEGQCLTSPSGQYRAHLQTDGNLIVFKSPNAIVWQTNSANKGVGPYRLLMQKENNLVTYDSKMLAVWWDIARVRPGPATVTMQDDGNLVIYVNGIAAWSWMTGVISGDTLGNGQTLFENECLKSKSNVYRACMQTDGNFVVYKDAGTVMWSSNTAGGGQGPYRLYMQKDDDNNLVVYDSKTKALWWDIARKRPGPATVTMQDDGNLVIHAQGKAVWSWMTGVLLGDTLGNGQIVYENECLRSKSNIYRACVLKDGNLVVYKDVGSGTMMWASNSANKGTGPYHLLMQTANNLVLYDSKGTPVWYDLAAVRPGPASLIMQDDGNLVVQSPPGKAVWSWMTGLIK
jgi:hypothetical protein